MCFVAVDTDDPACNYVLTKPAPVNHGLTHDVQGIPIPTIYDAGPVESVHKASTPRSSTAFTSNTELNARDDLDNMISTTFERLYAGWNDDTFVEREDSPFKHQAPNPVSPSVAFRVIHESERINEPTPNGSASSNLQRENHRVGQHGRVKTKNPQLSGITTAYVCVGGKERIQGSRYAMTA